MDNNVTITRGAFLLMLVVLVAMTIYLAMNLFFPSTTSTYRDGYKEGYGDAADYCIAELDKLIKENQ